MFIFWLLILFVKIFNSMLNINFDTSMSFDKNWLYDMESKLMLNHIDNQIIIKLICIFLIIIANSLNDIIRIVRFDISDLNQIV